MRMFWLFRIERGAKVEIKAFDYKTVRRYLILNSLANVLFFFVHQCYLMCFSFQAIRFFAFFRFFALSHSHFKSKDTRCDAIWVHFLCVFFEWIDESTRCWWCHQQHHQRLMPYHGLLMDARRKVNTLSHEHGNAWKNVQNWENRSTKSNWKSSLHTHAFAAVCLYNFTYAFSRCHKPPVCISHWRRNRENNCFRSSWNNKGKRQQQH